MVAASDVRRDARELLADIEPGRLASELRDIVADASMLPGVITVKTAEALGGPQAAAGARPRAVGVQLSYEGLRLTRDLIRHDERYGGEDPTESYLALVGAEVMVARGFSELADTAVAGDAIEIVQCFSHSQTMDYHGDSSGRSLEYDVIRLAVGAGANVVRESTPPWLDAEADRLAAEFDREPLPSATDVSERIRRGVTASPTGEDPVLLND